MTNRPFTALLTTAALAVPALFGRCINAQQVVAIQDVRVLDGTGAPPQEHMTVILADGKIKAITPAALAEIPPNAKLVPGAGETAMPAMVSDHMHLGLVQGTTVGPDNYTQPLVLAELAQYERYGITTVTSLGVNADLFFTLRPQLHAGTLPGADLFGAGRGIGVTGGAPPIPVGPDRIYRVATPAEARAAVRESAKTHPDLIKIWVDDFHGSLPVKMSPETYRAAIDEAHKHHLRIAAHIYYLADAKDLVNAGIDVLAHGVRDQPVDAAFIAAMKAHSTWYIPTLDLDEASYIYAQHPAWMDSPFFTGALSTALSVQFTDPAWQGKILGDTKSVDTSKASLATNEANLKTLYDAGVKIGFGTDSGANALRIPGFAEHRELQLMVASGLTPTQALHVATQNAAQLLTLTDRGLLAPGKVADVVLLQGDPTTDITAADNIVAVYHRGRLVATGNAGQAPVAAH